MRGGACTVFLLLLACGTKTSLPDDARPDVGEEMCEGTGTTCATLYGNCCEDVGFEQTCTEGEWRCDPCVLGESHCEDSFVRDSDCSRTLRDKPVGVDPAEFCGVE